MATESSILKYQDEGFELLYAHRSLLKIEVHGPEIVKNTEMEDDDVPQLVDEDAVMTVCKLKPLKR